VVTFLVLARNSGFQETRPDARIAKRMRIAWKKGTILLQCTWPKVVRRAVGATRLSRLLSRQTRSPGPQGKVMLDFQEVIGRVTQRSWLRLVAIDACRWRANQP
jgi:hypothetical protein